ncbi:uncharacterized protein PGTG_21641 [Puccinia graminis f. sp. tritici CRL 75-36-700-3]|uniref:DDE Tnp4 domain-containing protein n=1 Tax=Puccinia graminis f. sp. tritici (strain CRL 75-36-700-3 / race SCCL) TaxID=418459 RepID=H6QRP6_PUCGT|nr:uncharacterized protein PGTG_21641 [Puccinia graminis f. sp. tritici CRL 75-36-700-3]EHS63340.1 hypothetical protein PGTG_21641 [Puccinia graminis f. sp. tritici CRL 75-36-700-3]
MDGCHVPCGPIPNWKGVPQYHTEVPETKEELYNLRHLMLKNVFEQTFGTWKKKFPILFHLLEYSLFTPRDLVLALAVLHNIIIEHSTYSEGFVIDPNEDGAATGEDDLPSDKEEEPKPYQACERERNNVWRDQIAADMWTQYQEYLQSCT